MSGPAQRPPPPLLAARASNGENSDVSSPNSRVGSANLSAPASARESRHHGRGGDGNEEGGGGSGSAGGGNGSARPKRTLIESACSACRRRKSRCDGVRPACSRCQSLRTDCLYEAEEGESRWSALRRRNQMLETERAEVRELISYVQTRPEPEALEIFQRIRKGQYDDVFILLREIREGSMPAVLGPRPPSASPGAHSLPLHPVGPAEPQHRLPPISTMFEMSAASPALPSTSNMPPGLPGYYLTSEHSHGSTSSGMSTHPEPPVSSAP